MNEEIGFTKYEIGDKCLLHISFFVDWKFISFYEWTVNLKASLKDYLTASSQ